MNFEIAVGLSRVYRFNDVRRVQSNHRPLRRCKNDNRYLSANKILLISDVLVSREKNFEPGPLRFSQQVAIG